MINQSYLYAFAEIALVWIVITLITPTMPDGFVSYVVREFGGVGFYVIAGIVYICLRILLMRRFEEKEKTKATATPAKAITQ